MTKRLSLVASFVLLLAVPAMAQVRSPLPRVSYLLRRFRFRYPPSLPCRYRSPACQFLLVFDVQTGRFIGVGSRVGLGISTWLDEKSRA